MFPQVCVPNCEDEPTDLVAMRTLADAIGCLMAPMAMIADSAGLHRIAFLMHEIVGETHLAHEVSELGGTDEEAQ